jgi:hypothetical protein
LVVRTSIRISSAPWSLFRHVGCPVQQRGTQPESGVAPANDDSSYAQHRPLAFLRRPDGTLVHVQGFIHVDRDGRSDGLPVSQQPCLAFEQVIQDALSLSGRVGSQFLPLIDALATQPASGFPDKSGYFVQIPRHSKA